MSLNVRKGVVKQLIPLLLIIVGPLALYSFLLEPNMISVNSVSVTTDELHAALHDKMVAQISDLHVTSVGYRENSLLEKLNKLRPDILFMTGDFLTDGEDEDLCVSLLRQIRRPRLGIWAVLGNSDIYGKDGERRNIDRFTEKLSRIGISVLRNARTRIPLDDNRTFLYLVGVEGPHLSNSKLAWLLSDIPDDSPVILLSHYPDILEQHPGALVVNLEDAKDEGVAGWGWQDNAFFAYDSGIVRFERDGQHTLRVQRREDGVAIAELCLVNVSNETLPQYQSSDQITESDLLKEPKLYYEPINPHDKEMITIKARDIPDVRVFGGWTKLVDSTANSGLVIKDTPDKALKNETPLLNPKNYFEADFYAKGGIDYHVWVRMKAENDSSESDSVYLQFSDTVNRKGDPVYRIDEYATRKDLHEIDLILAGHTHGGQVRLPLIGSLDIIGTLNMVPNHRIKYDMGLFQSQGAQMYVNRGIGTSFLPIRFLCPPEITFFQFEKRINFP